MVSQDDVIEVLKTVVDPELYIDIWTLGLIYSIDICGGTLSIRMTFTSFGCPAGPLLVQQVRERTQQIPGIEETQIEIVFDPPWEPSEELKAMMGIA